MDDLNKMITENLKRMRETLKQFHLRFPLTPIRISPMSLPDPKLLPEELSRMYARAAASKKQTSGPFKFRYDSTTGQLIREADPSFFEQKD